MTTNHSVNGSPGRWLLALAVASGLAFVGLALMVAGGPLPIDLTVAAALAPLHAGAIGAAIDTLNAVGQPVRWDALVVLVGVGLWLSGRRFEAIVLVGGLIAADLGATAAKVIVGRQRPPGVEVADLITQASYPSGHVTRAVVTAGLLAAIGRRWREAPGTSTMAVGLVAVGAGVLMGIARIAVGEHWFTDVAGAILYGLAAVAVVRLVALAVMRRLRPGDWPPTRR